MAGDRNDNACRGTGKRAAGLAVADATRDRTGLRAGFRRRPCAAHLRHAIIVGLIVYNIYNLTSLYLMADIQPFTVAMRLFVLVPGSLAIFWLVPRLPPVFREILLLQGMFVASLLPLFLLYLSASPYASYTLGELPLVLLFGNMLLVLRFRLALIFTFVTCLAALWVIHTKPGLDPNLIFPLTVQAITGLFFTLYGNWHFERQRCLSYVAQYDAQNRADQAERIGDELRDLTRTDALTGIANRRHLEEVLSGWRTGHDAMLLLMVDVDHFKAYNDRLGHVAGDEALRRIAATLKAFADRHDGFVARYGGEEFTLVFSADVETGGAFLADRLVRTVRELGLPHPARPDGLFVVTVSAGYAGAGEADRGNPLELVTRADEALYAAKSAGRNRSKAG
ncbi:diguanylate cyclase [Rhizobium sp. Root274]|uniref:GGDEF domain-containing protein n=1 Tax=unclassified Rhizobium TaxID=2613769 RepID=UPI000713572F|nr:MULTISPECIES: GGDEF domain-containing protein [unclassified Rhizobium]KRD32704.1 diguanylate cyclase [Rhizobium sp. Root274]